jgi:hypothetical protein
MVSNRQRLQNDLLMWPSLLPRLLISKLAETQRISREAGGEEGMSMSIYLALPRGQCSNVVRKYSDQWPERGEGVNADWTRSVADWRDELEGCSVLCIYMKNIC